MLSKARADLPLRDLATRSASFGAVPAVLLVILGAGTPLPWLVALPLAAVSMVLVGLVTASRMLGQAYVAGWAERSERRDFWMSAFMFMKDRAPTLLNEAGLPTEQEWQQTRGGAVGSFDAPPEPEGPPPTLKERVLGAPAALLGVVRAVLGLPGALLSKVRRRPSDDVDPAQFMDDEDERDLDELDEDDELDDGFGGPGAYDPYATPGAFDDGPGADEPYAPEVKVATFLYPPNSVFSDYQSEAHRVRGALGVDLCAFSPIGSFVNEAEAPGTVGAQGFRVWWTEQEIPDLLTPDLGHWMREFLVRALVIPGLSEIKGIGWCQLVSCGMVTRPESGKTVVKADVVPPAGVSLETFLQSLPQIQTVLGVPWARAGRGAGRGAGGSITLFFGEYPTPDDTRFINPASIVRKQIDQMDWAYYFQTQKADRRHRRTEAGRAPAHHQDRRQAGLRAARRAGLRGGRRAGRAAEDDLGQRVHGDRAGRGARHPAHGHGAAGQGRGRAGREVHDGRRQARPAEAGVRLRGLPRQAAHRAHARPGEDPLEPGRARGRPAGRIRVR